MEYRPVPSPLQGSADGTRHPPHIATFGGTVAPITLNYPKKAGLGW